MDWQGHIASVGLERYDSDRGRRLLGVSELTTEACAIAEFLRSWGTSVWSLWVPVLGQDVGIDYPRVGTRVPWDGAFCDVIKVSRDGSTSEHSILARTSQGRKVCIPVTDWYLGTVGRLIRVAR